MTIEVLAYWSAFCIPIILLVMTGFIRKLVDGADFKREHWYLGIDLTIYFLASALVNILDIAKAPHPNERAMVYTVLLITGAVVMLIGQATLHQIWVPRVQHPRQQLLILCGLSNAFGLSALYFFVRLKAGGLI